MQMEQWPPQHVQRRISVIGPPLVGKLEILRALAARDGRTLQHAEIGSPHTIVNFVAGDQYVAATCSGAVWSIGTWELLIRWSSAVLVTLDPQRALEPAIRGFLEQVRPMLAHTCRVAVQVTKVDLARKHPSTCFVPGQVPQIYGLGLVPAFCSTIRSRRTLVSGLAYLIAGAA
jgi:hypothetical protein